MINSAPVIVWFRRDLRLGDNPALATAAARGGSIVPVFLPDACAENPWAPGLVGRWWLNRSLERLNHSLKQAGGHGLVLRRGPPETTLLALARETGARAVFWNRMEEPWAWARDDGLALLLARAGLGVATFNAALLWEPADIVSAQGRPYRMFTPFWRACRNAALPPRPLPLPSLPPFSQPWPQSDPHDGWDWGADAPPQLDSAWAPGEMAAAARLAAFLDQDSQDYCRGRDRLDGDEAISRLSPHLHWGEISPRQVWHGVLARRAALGDAEAGDIAGLDAFLRQLGWREFCHHLLHHHPTLPQAPLNPHFAAFPWQPDAGALAAWQQGRTGYPVVDAAMRGLAATGWMPNRLRMITASFLTKHLLQPWTAGAAWFHQRLVDADLANNIGGWQWVAGCGADAAPFFRIFNPTLQGKKFDPQGVNLRRWLPELAALPERYLHEPHRAPAAVRALAGVSDYPAPLVDHAAARARALAAWQHCRDSTA